MTICLKSNEENQTQCPQTRPRPMTDFNVFSAFLIGIAGGVHCVGMCGGIAAAFSATIPPTHPKSRYIALYNFGRITSYTLAGAATGLLGSVVSVSFHQGLLYLSIASGVVLLLLACYLGNWWKVLVHLETAGAALWKQIQPLSKRFLPVDSFSKAFLYGVIWGWLPCGLVYSTLTWAIASGSAADGAVIMLAFGLGTLPTLFAASLSAQWLVAGFRHPVFRQIIAILIAVYAIYLIYNGYTSIKYI